MMNKQKLTMKKVAVLLSLALCLLPARSMAEVPPAKKPAEATQKQEPLKPGDVLGMAAAVGMLGAITVDATLGEAFVRAYPSKQIAAQGWGDMDGSIKLSCDTYRDVSGNHLIAVASACNIGYLLVAKNSAYTLSGPFKPVERFEGRSCDVARKVCEAYRVTVTRNGKLVELREKNKLLGTVNFSGQTPQYSIAK
jgi:hypothetical protein